MPYNEQLYLTALGRRRFSPAGGKPGHDQSVEKPQQYQFKKAAGFWKFSVATSWQVASDVFNRRLFSKPQRCLHLVAKRTLKLGQKTDTTNRSFEGLIHPPMRL